MANSNKSNNILNCETKDKQSPSISNRLKIEGSPVQSKPSQQMGITEEKAKQHSQAKTEEIEDKNGEDNKVRQVTERFLNDNEEKQSEMGTENKSGSQKEITILRREPEIGFKKQIKITIEELTVLSKAKQKMLSSFTLYFYELANSKITKVFWLFPDLKSLIKLDLDIYSRKFTNKGVAALALALQNHKKLSTLKISLRKCGKISDNGIRTLASSIGTLRLLSKLDLAIGSSPSFTDKGIKSLCQAFKKLRLLSHLSLELYRLDQITYEGIQIFSSNLKHLELLSSLSFKIVFGDQLSDNAAIERFSRALKDLKSLKDLSLYFNSDPQPDSQTLETLFQSMKSLNSLSCLNLEFLNYDDLHDTDVENLSLVLESLTTLKSLNLNFIYCRKLNDKSIESLSLALEKLQLLAHLKLKFCNCRLLSNNGIKSLSLALKQLERLSSLHLDFSNCQIDNKGLELISSVIKNAPLLSNLVLYFFNCREISNEGLANFSLDLKNLKTLAHLNLNWNDYKRKISESKY